MALVCGLSHSASPSRTGRSGRTWPVKLGAGAGLLHSGTVSSDTALPRVVPGILPLRIELLTAPLARPIQGIHQYG